MQISIKWLLNNYYLFSTGGAVQPSEDSQQYIQLVEYLK